MIRLVVVWTSEDREVALKMVFMYTLNSKLHGWWKDITFLIWGPSSKLLSEDAFLQEKIKQFRHVGIRVEACIDCARQYGVTEALRNLGVDVKAMGAILTDYAKEGRHILTF